jgi:hypothetical protein
MALSVVPPDPIQSCFRQRSVTVVADRVQSQDTAWRACPASVSMSRARSLWRPGRPPLTLFVSPFHLCRPSRERSDREGSDCRRANHPNPKHHCLIHLDHSTTVSPTRPQPHRAAILPPGRAHREGGSTGSPCPPPSSSHMAVPLGLLTTPSFPCFRCG